MSNEIKEMIKKMDENVNERLSTQDKMMQQLIKLVAANNERFNDMEAHFNSVEHRLERIEESLIRIEENEPADIIAMLNQINSKLDERDNEIQALNKRVFKTESEIERLTRQ